MMCPCPCASKGKVPPDNANAPTSPKKGKPCGPKPCDGSTCGKCPKNAPEDKGKDGPSGFGGFSAPPNNRGPVALGLAALLFAAGVFLTTKLGIVANEIG